MDTTQHWPESIRFRGTRLRSKDDFNLRMYRDEVSVSAYFFHNPLEVFEMRDLVSSSYIVSLAAKESNWLLF